MRHNTSISYRSDGNNTLNIFLRIFSAVLILALFTFCSVPASARQEKKNTNNQTGTQVNAQANTQTGTQTNQTNTQTDTVNNPQTGTQTTEAVPGQGFDDKDFGPQVEEESVVWMIIKTIMVLGLFIGGFYMFYKFVTQKAGLQFSGHEAIQILSMVPVGPNRTLQIIDVAGRVYLLGISESGISMLTEIKDKEEIDRIRLLSSRSTPVKDLTFQDFITDQVGWVVDRFHDAKEKINDRKNRGSVKSSVQEISEKEFDMSYLNKQKSRLKNINEDDEE